MGKLHTQQNKNLPKCWRLRAVCMQLSLVMSINVAREGDAMLSNPLPLYTTAMTQTHRAADLLMQAFYPLSSCVIIGTKPGEDLSGIR